MELSLPEQRRLVFETVVPMRWGDMDAMGHVNNTLYFRYMEIGRMEWLHALLQQAGQGPDAPPPGQGPVVVNAFCNFLRELRHPGSVLVRVYAANPGRSSFDTFYELLREDRPGEVYANGGAKVVWIDHEARKSVELPAAMRRAVEG